MSPKDKELIATAVSVAAGCEPCTKHHIKAARDVGASAHELETMVNIAIGVRERATRKMHGVAWAELDVTANGDGCACEAPAFALEALASAASALAANCGSGVPGYLEASRKAGASERDGEVALGIARHIKKVAAEKNEEAAVGTADKNDSKGCAAATAEAAGSGTCC